MTSKKRLVYLFGLIGVFIVVIPLILLYSFGYRLGSGFRLVKTGGIYLVNNESDTTVTLNGKSLKRFNIFEKNILIRSLMPEIYYVRMEKEGYRPWKKNIKVLEEKVEVVYPLLVPLKLNPQFVPKYLMKEGNTQKKREPNEEFSQAMKIFKTYNNPVKSMIPGWENSDIKKYKLNDNRKLYKKVLLLRQDNKIYAKWTGTEEKRPFFINYTEGKLVYSSDKNILSFGFFPGKNDAILVLLEDLNLYAVEIDTRYEIQNTYLIAANCSRFAVVDEFLYYFSAGALYRIDFEL
jgi:hypothetical protein